MPPSRPSGATSIGDQRSSVSITKTTWLRRAFAFSGPAYLVSVGYMDPGNWATDLEGGSRFGYKLLWVLLLSNLLAILLQTLSARLGIVTGRDLAESCRDVYPTTINRILWALSEIAIAACDLAEVLGAAIALNLLFHVPLIAGVLITAADTLLVLWFTRFGMRVVEALVIVLIATIGGCFFIEILFAKPSLHELASGFVPWIDGSSLYAAIAILGATVMPHNLYLHSALVQTRQIGSTEEEKRTACRFNLLDSAVALNFAFLVNSAILVVAATVFFKHGVIVTEIQQAHQLLSPLLGTTLASVLFAAALLCSGQSSTLTGTMAGQIIMEGFLNLRLRPWLRRLITRTAAITPAVIAILVFGEKSIYNLLIYSQVLLSLQLPFAIIPLVRLTNSRQKMGSFRNSATIRVLAWSSAALVIALNLALIKTMLAPLVTEGLGHRVWVLIAVVPALVFLMGLLGWMTFEPLFERVNRTGPLRRTDSETARVDTPWVRTVYRSILIPLDHTAGDRPALQHAMALARVHQSKLYLLHIEEGVASQVYGALASSAEVVEGNRYLEDLASSIRQQGFDAETAVRHAKSPRREIVAFAREVRPDLIIMAGHGHKGLKDIIFGTTINAVRHDLRLPILIVREKP